MKRTIITKTKREFEVIDEEQYYHKDAGIVFNAVTYGKKYRYFIPWQNIDIILIDKDNERKVKKNDKRN